MFGSWEEAFNLQMDGDYKMVQAGSRISSVSVRMTKTSIRCHQNCTGAEQNADHRPTKSGKVLPGQYHRSGKGTQLPKMVTPEAAWILPICRFTVHSRITPISLLLSTSIIVSSSARQTKASATSMSQLREAFSLMDQMNGVCTIPHNEGH